MTVKLRLNWIDWMKAFGMYFIVLGHLFSVGFQYVYVFSVPLFFVISGFLCKKETDHQVFWKKLFYNLVLPMLLISVICLGLDSLLALHAGNYDKGHLVKFPFELILGFQAATKNLWFVYTLIILKMVVEFCPPRKEKTILIMLMMLFPICSILLRLAHPEVVGIDIANTPNSIINVCLAYPFFALGYLLRPFRDRLQQKQTRVAMTLAIVVSLALVILCGKYNAPVMMYANNYGSNIFLFFLGGIAGTVLIYEVGKMLDSVHASWVLDISKGCILILGFQWYLLNIVYKLRPGATLLDWLFAAVVVIAFIPVIRFVERYMPLLMGKYRVK